MDVQKISRTSSGLSASRQMHLRFEAPQTIGGIVAATAAGATILTDADGRTMPRVGDVIDPSLPGLIAKNIDVSPLDSCTWRITVNYSSSPSKYASTAEEEGKKPWTLDPVVRWSPLTSEFVAERCYVEGDVAWAPTGLIRLPNGRPYFDPPLELYPGGIATITWNTRDSIIDYAEEIEFSLNADTVTLGTRTLLPQTGFLQSIVENVELWEDGTEYYSHETQVIYKRLGHNWQPVNMDYYAIIDGVLRRIQIKEGQYGYWGADDPEAVNVTDPVYLDMAGGLLTTDPQETGLAPDVGDFQIYPAQDWSLIGL